MLIFILYREKKVMGLSLLGKWLWTKIKILSQNPKLKFMALGRIELPTSAFLIWFKYHESSALPLSYRAENIKKGRFLRFVA